MIEYNRIKFRNRLISWFPWISSLSETRRLILAGNEWRRCGWTVPVPYFVRRAMLVTEARACGARVFVETGTFLGGTTWSLRNHFEKIHTIEVEPSLAALARDRFTKWPSISVIEGDSAQLLPGICSQIHSPCLFYLDGHYSGGITGKGEKECPIVEELGAIFSNIHQPFRIVIDDARLFGTDPFYPPLAVIEEFLGVHGKGMQMRIENDAIVIFS
jgi:hypothetical protein